MTLQTLQIVAIIFISVWYVAVENKDSEPMQWHLVIRNSKMVIEDFFR